MESDLSLISEYQRAPAASGMFVDGWVLPDDILVEILLTLPIRHLLRLRCVCKSWCALIDHFNFINRHYEFCYSICVEDEHIPSICYGPQTDLRNHDLHLCLFSKQNGDVPLNLIPDLRRDSMPSFANAPDFFKKAFMVGVVNGIVCIIWGFTDVGLWNPGTREFKAITPWLYDPIEPFFLGFIGFGFDCVSNDFKVVRGNTSADGTHRPEVYSLNSNTWKRVTVPSPFAFGSRDNFMEAYLNGVCYWSVTTVTFDASKIMSFNFSTDVLEVFDQPQNAFSFDIGEHGGFDWAITLYKERLAFVVIHTEDSDWEVEVRKLDVWVVTKYHENSGNPVEWQRMLTIGPFPLSNIRYFDAFRMDGDVLFTVGGPSTGLESSLYNPSTGSFNNYGVILGSFWGYVESLFPLSKKLIWS